MDKVKYRIEFFDEIFFKQKYRRVLLVLVEEVCIYIKDLLVVGIIRLFYFLFLFNVVLVRKYDGFLWLCIDYRYFNFRIIKDNYVLFRIEEILDFFLGNIYFSVLDMKFGYYQIEIVEEYKERIVFIVGLFGFYEFNCMSFGFVNVFVIYQCF